MQKTRTTQRRKRARQNIQRRQTIIRWKRIPDLPKVA